jgi:aminopeptidase N
MFRAVLDGFEDPDQRDLLAPYTQRYFEVVGGIWRDWSPDMAQWFVANAYPVADTRAVIEATHALIADTSPPAALRRLLIEGRDSAERALRCQERDRQAG